MMRKTCNRKGAYVDNDPLPSNVRAAYLCVCLFRHIKFLQQSGLHLFDELSLSAPKFAYSIEYHIVYALGPIHLFK